MNPTLATFLKIALTATTIGLLLFGVAYTMVQNEGNAYKADIEAVKNDLPQ